jgi:Uri superfamily endonuclease
VTRHFRRDNALHWHVDQLTEQGTVIGNWIVPGGYECALVEMLPHMPVPIIGFGSSDRRTCRSHLLHWPEGSALPWL